ncbi:MAG: hypothetical protein KFF49_03565, partial [Bacteroidales bacterium]|nr:hypothetical protein [Bacteroidales bacterium]
MRPYKTLLVLLVLLVLLYGPAFFISGPLRIAPGISISWPEISSEYFVREYPRVDTAKETSLPVPVQDTLDAHTPATLPEKDPGNLFDYSPSQTLSGTLKDLLYKADGSLRIMYYGDSQLEGDRITYHIREELRKDLHGTGPGLLGITPLVPYTRTSYVRMSDNWQKYDYLDYRDGLISHRELGPLMTISRFTEPGTGSDTRSLAWFSLEPSMFADSLSAIYEQLRLFYGKLEDSLFVRVQTGEGLIRTDTLMPSHTEQEYTVNLDLADYLKVTFEGRSSPDFYGFSIESSEGAIVDNITRRGSAGFEYTMIPRDNLASLYGM